MRIYPFEWIVQFGEWYERTRGRDDVVLTLVSFFVITAWTLVSALIMGQLE